MIAASLRSAQLQLRASWRFRHPYYWASLIDLEAAPVVRDAAVERTAASP
jgi:hypothetical protein